MQGPKKVVKRKKVVGRYVQALPNYLTVPAVPVVEQLPSICHGSNASCFPTELPNSTLTNAIGSDKLLIDVLSDLC